MEKSECIRLLSDRMKFITDWQMPEHCRYCLISLTANKPHPPGSFRRFEPFCLFGSLTIVNTAARFAQNFISPPVFCSPGHPAGKDKPFAATPKTANISKQFFKTARRIIYPSKKLQLLHYTQSLLFFNLIAKTIRFITLCTVAGYGDCSMRANRNAKKRPATEAAGLFRLPKLKTCSQL